MAWEEGFPAEETAETEMVTAPVEEAAPVEAPEAVEPEAEQVEE